MNFLLLLPLLLQANGAQSAFQEIEAAWEKARTVQMKVSVRIVGQAGDTPREKTAIGSLVIADKGRIRISLARGGDEPKTLLKLVSDGKRIDVESESETNSFECPVGVETRLKKSLFRIGLFGSMTRDFRPRLIVSGKNPVQVDVEKLIGVSDLSFGDTSDGYNSLKYAVRIEGESEKNEIQLWYDAKTFRPIRRVLTLKVNNATATECCEEFKLDAPITGDELLPLPKK